MVAWQVALGIVAVGAPLLMLRWRRPGQRVAIAAAAVTLLAGVAFPRSPRPEKFVPKVLPREGYVQSTTCRGCHPGAYDSWHRTYHRTMAQLATPETVRGKFDGSEYEVWGQKYRLERQGDEFWVHMPDIRRQTELYQQGVNPLGLKNLPLSPHRVVLLTGSHHMQVYWVQGIYDRQPIELPLYYSIDQQRWMPKNDSVLNSPGPKISYGSWHARCSTCHSIGATPGLQPETGEFDSRVAELGISCEACHGPGDEHVRFHQNPLNRYRRHLAQDADDDPTIVNPAECSSKVSTQICGRCHSASKEKDYQDYLQNGIGFRPGDDLTDYYEMFEFVPEKLDSDIEMRNQFWADGTCRVGGDEYEAFIKSPCYERGELSCLSCHSMHHSDPNDQLAARMEGNEACLQCHESLRQDVEAHTHHAAGSAGSLCYNCHMPHTTFALFTAMRSHRVDSPSAAVSAQTNKPNACNLCHLDRTLEWTSQQLAEWYGQPQPALEKERRTVAESVIWTMRGDAVQRVIWGWHMGWQPALEASGSHWQAPFLAKLLKDPYTSARYMGQHSLTQLPGYEDFQYDFLGDEAQRPPAAAEALERFRSLPWPGEQRDAVLIDADGSLQQDAVSSLLQRRDNAPVSIPE